MALTRTRQQIREEARSLADLPEADSLVLDTTLNTWIDRYHKDLYELLWGTAGRHYFLKDGTLTGTGPTLDLPADFLDLEGIYYTDTRGQAVQALPPDYYPFADEVTEAVSFRMRYVPTPTMMTSDSDTLDTIVGWDDFIVYNLTADLLAVEQNENLRWTTKAEEAKARIIALAGNRKAGPVLRKGWRHIGLRSSQYDVHRFRAPQDEFYYQLKNGNQITFYRVGKS